jgi:hypothetical protein
MKKFEVQKTAPLSAFNTEFDHFGFEGCMSDKNHVCLFCQFLDVFPHYTMCLLHGEKITAIEDSGCRSFTAKEQEERYRVVTAAPEVR